MKNLKKIIDSIDKIRIKNSDEKIDKDLYDLQQSIFKMMDNVKSVSEIKEDWASSYDKTWSEILSDMEYGNGVSKIYSYDKIINFLLERCLSQ